MKIEAQLTDRERDLLCLMMGAATGFMLEHFGNDVGPECVILINKLMAHDPEYMPYDAHHFDPSKPFPFKFVPRQ